MSGWRCYCGKRGVRKRAAQARTIFYTLAPGKGQYNPLSEKNVGGGAANLISKRTVLATKKPKRFTSRGASLLQAAPFS